MYYCICLHSLNLKCIFAGTLWTCLTYRWWLGSPGTTGSTWRGGASPTSTWSTSFPSTSTLKSKQRVHPCTLIRETTDTSVNFTDHCKPIWVVSLLTAKQKILLCTVWCSLNIFCLIWLHWYWVQAVELACISLSLTYSYKGDNLYKCEIFRFTVSVDKRSGEDGGCNQGKMNNNL